MNSSSPSLSSNFLRRAYDRARKTLLVWSAAAVLAASALTGAGRLGWLARGEIYALAPALLAAALLGWWLKRVARLTPASFAQTLDTRWEMRSRLESAVELSGDDSALAQAQRAETAARLAGRENTGLAPWLAGLAVVVFALGFIGVEGGALVLRILQAEKKVEAAKAKAAVPVDDRASLEWKTPQKEIKATAIEEVPLTAEADSTKGFRAVSLEVFLNGEHNLSRTLDAAALGESAHPGVHELTPSLFIDETGAKPFDIVSYHLVGEVNGAAPGHVVTSPLQFVQIRPPQRDVAKKGTANPDAVKLLSLLSQLKLAQLHLIEANFTLSKMTNAKDDPAWRTENSRVATDQKELAKKADETRAFASEKNAPPLIAKNLGEARSLMIEAAKSIEARENDDATKPQGRALALITECEKLFGQALEMTGPPPPPLPMEDPFHDDQVFKLPPREETAAGELEKLAARQREASAQLALESGDKNPGSGSGSGDSAAAENAIAHDVNVLAANGQFDPAAQKNLQDAAAAASKAARQLAAHDVSAAREPAGAALAALEKALEIQDRAGKESAVEELTRARRALNEASRDDSTGDRGAKLLVTRDDLRAAATQQQRTGSAEAARQLAAVAEQLGAQKILGSPSKSNSQERAREVATAAARSQIALAPRTAASNRVVRQLNRAKQPGGATGGLAPELIADLEIAAQEAEWLTSDAQTIELARALVAQSSAQLGLSPKAGGSARALAEAATKLADALELARLVGKRDEIVRHFNVEDIDPAYRAAVENYFERLSREGAKTSSVPAAP